MEQEITREVTQFEGRYILRVTTEETEENGVPRCYERAYFREGAIVIPITREGKIRFIREKPWASEVIKTKLVTGYVDDGETPLEAAKRELREETGLTADEWIPILRAEKSGAINKVRNFFVAKHLREGTANPEVSENIFGTMDLPPREVRRLALLGEFGTSESAFVLLLLTDR